MWKKLVMISLLAIFMIGAASASDDFENNLTIDENAILQESASDAELILQADTFDGDTYSGLQDKINNANDGALIELQKDIKYVSDDEKCISIDKPVTIDGKGCSIDADGDAKIFKVTGANVVLKNIKFINSYSDEYGSCLEWYGENGIVDNCTFMNSHSSYGGAVYWEGVGGNIHNSKFVNNNAEFGGALALYESNIKVSTSTFINNSAATGGAVDCSSDGCTISSSRFINNSASIGSGAIAWYGENGELFNSTFIANHADLASGAIDWSGMGMKITNCNFTGNYADSYGSLSTFSENGVVNNSIFTNNYAISEVGGSIYADSYGLSFTNSIFKNNTARVAGAIYWAGENVIFENITLSNNSAKVASNIFVNGENAELIDIESNDTDLLYCGEDIQSIPTLKKRVEISNELVKYSNWAFLNITLSKNLDLNITITINGQNRTIKSKDGKAQLNLTDLENGDYNVSINIYQDGIISDPVKDSFNIFMIRTILIADDFVTYEYSKEKLPIYMFDDDGNPISNKKLILTIGNKTYSASIGDNGTGLKNINLASGNYNLMIAYKGDETYLKSQINISLIVKPKVVITTNLVTNKNNVSYAVSLSKKLNETLILCLNGVNTTVKSTDGKLVMNFSDLDYGNYTIRVYMDDMYYYNEIIDNFTVTVKKTFLSGANLEVLVGDLTRIGLTLKDSKNNPVASKMVRFHIDGQTFENVTDENGFTDMYVSFNSSGKYPVSMEFEGDEVYMPSNAIYLVTAKNKISADITLNKHYNDVVVNVALSQKINTTLEILVNDKVYSISVVEGKATLKLNNLKSSSYKVSLKLNDPNYGFGNAAPASSFKVTAKDVAMKNALKVKLSLKKVTVKKSAKKLVLTATLKINGKVAKNKKIKFKFNKKTYTGKTNKKGIAKVTIKKSVLKKLKVGKKIKYRAVYGKKTVSKTVKIKR